MAWHCYESGFQERFAATEHRASDGDDPVAEEPEGQHRFLGSAFAINEQSEEGGREGEGTERRPAGPAVIGHPLEKPEEEGNDPAREQRSAEVVENVLMLFWSLVEVAIEKDDRGNADRVRHIAYPDGPSQSRLHTR